MRVHRMLGGVLAAVVAVVVVAGPASAAKPRVEQIGRGPWTATASGATFTGETTGTPLDGATVGSVAVDDGTMPPWPGCEPGSGSITTSNGNRTFTVTFSGNLCWSVAPTGHLVLIGWYDVTEFTGAKGKRIADGRGSIDLRVLADGTAQWMLSGDLY
jgi:hypothetical protein